MRLIPAILVTLAAALPVAAHEFWLSPESYTVAEGQPITVTSRVGEKFNAASRPFLPGSFVTYEVVSGDQVVPVTARIGDDPVRVAVPEGLAVVVHETIDSRLTYTDPEKWTAFIEHKAFPGAAETHAARGLPDKDFSERYRRFGKSLVAVGTGAGADRPMGLRTEIVALANPYAETLDQLPVQVWFEGAPRVDAQVELFDRGPDGAVVVTTTRTDAQGKAVLPVTPGHDYLVDAVVLLALPNDDVAAGPVWESLWASLTFAVPAR